MQDNPHSIAPGGKRRRKKKPATPQAQPSAGLPPQPVIEAGTRPSGPSSAVRAAAPAPSLAIRLWAVMRSEPALMVTTAYLFVSFIGIWANYWFFRRFDLPILEYMQGGDYLVAGLRDPIYAYAVIGIAAASMLIVWLEKWRALNPDRVRRMSRYWWGRVLMGEGRFSSRWYLGMSRETGLLVISLVTAMLIVLSYVDARAKDIRGGGGPVVRISLAGEATALPGTARLLGTNSSFVFLWWPQQKKVEALPTANVSRIESLVTPPAVAKPAATEPAAKPAAARTSAGTASATKP